MNAAANSNATATPIAPVVSAGRSTTAKAGAITASPAVAPAPTPVPPEASPSQAPTRRLGPWAQLFQSWPDEIPRRGVMISKLNEPTPFKAFMLQGELLLLERTTPDSLGGRFLIIAFDEIAAVKYTDPLKQPAFEAAGFSGQLSG